MNKQANDKLSCVESYFLHLVSPFKLSEVIICSVYFVAVAIMWIQVRTMDGQRSTQVDGLSKLTKIEELRTKLEEAFDVPPNKQRLFFRGKQVII